MILFFCCLYFSCLEFQICQEKLNKTLAKSHFINLWSINFTVRWLQQGFFGTTTISVYASSKLTSHHTMSFSELYGAVLSPFIKKFKLAKNEKEKKAIVKSASAAVSSKKELLEEGGDDLPEDLQAVCSSFHSYLFFNDVYVFRL